MTRRSLWIAVACAFAGGVLLAVSVHPFVGSGNTCEGIGFGCTPERDTDTLLVVTAYAVGALLTLLIARLLARRGSSTRRALIAGLVVTTLVTGATAWSQLPRHPGAPGPLGPAVDRWEQAFAEGRSAAPAGTRLGDALRGLRRRGPLECRDSYERSTGAHELRWSARATNDPATAQLVTDWAERLDRRAEFAVLLDPNGNSSSDRGMRVQGSGPAAGGSLTVNGSTYLAQPEIEATTGCHRD